MISLDILFVYVLSKEYVGYVSVGVYLEMDAPPGVGVELMPTVLRHTLYMDKGT